MKSRPLSVRPKSLAVLVAAAAIVGLGLPQDAEALGLGRLVVQSALGEALRAEIEVTSLTPEEGGSLRIRVAPPEAYRAAGVDYNPVLPGTRVTVQRRADGRVFLRLSSDRPVQEPFVDVIVEASWNTGRLVREYTLLLDPPTQRPPTAVAALPEPAEPPQQASPAFPAARSEGALPPPRAPRAAAPVRPPTLQAAAPEPPRRPMPPREAPPRAAEPPPAPPRAAAAPGAGDYEVRRGDTLTRIAARTQPPGVSTDQMLAALHRANPQAFIGGDIDRLRAGSVLVVPSADEVQALAGREARPGARAQAAADPGARRERIMAAAPLLPAEGPSRQAGGRVPAPGEERRPPAGGTGSDRLTLSRPGTPLSPAEELALLERESREATARAAELRRNVEELQRLAAAAAAASRAAGTAPATGPTAGMAAGPAGTSGTGTGSGTGSALSSTSTGGGTTSSGSAAVSPGTGSTGSGTAAPPSAAVPPLPSPTLPTTPATPAPEAAPVVAAAPPAPQPSLVQVPAGAAATPPASGAAGPAVVERTVVTDYAPALALGAAALALAGALAYYAARRRARRKAGEAGESSFFESRLTPDSNFAGGAEPRVDARDAAAIAAMNYTPGPLDAGGDVDPVAEADVYLAYGRDLQAEEILKEALRADPERLAIRSKLLEVYAKRRDTKGFELLAAQFYGLTGGQGDEWARAQALGAQIDPENPLYQPGGRPPAPPESDATTRSGSLLSPSTLPHSVLTQPFENSAAPVETRETARTGLPLGPDLPLDFGLGVDLDLDLSVPAPPRPAPVPEITRPMPRVASDTTIEATDFELPLGTLTAPEPAAPTRPDAHLEAPKPDPGAPLDFDISDLGALSFGVDAPVTHDLPALNSGAPLITDPGALGFDERLGGRAAASQDPADLRADAYERKIALAEEFRQIGDAEGARELLLEVLARATGAQKARAQSMLDALS